MAELLPMDAEKQQAYYELLEEEVGESLAFFYCCIRFDKPFDMKAIPAKSAKEKWTSYCEKLEKKGLAKTKGGGEYGFLDGLTDINRIFGTGLAKGEFSRAVDLEKSARDGKNGTKRQVADWGEGGEKSHYTTEDYNEFDRIYNALCADFGGEGNVSAKQQLILRNVAKWTKQMNDAAELGQIDKAKKLSSMIQENLASENLRKKDTKPVEELRLDNMVLALERAGLLKNGKPCDPDEAFKIFFGRPCKYPYTRDAADQMILINENRMRQNDGMPELAELPDEMRLRDDLGEFAKEPNEAEKEAYEKLGLVRMRPVKGSE
jgi:hypothetical protein